MVETGSSKSKRDDKNTLNLDFANWVLKSSAVFNFVEGYKNVIKIGNNAQTTVLNILKTTNSRNAEWLLRFDKPHPGANYPHINLRHKYTKIKDPHTRLPPGTLAMAKYGGYSCKLLYVLRKVTFVYDIYRLGAALYKDYCIGKGTYDNTVICLTAIVLEWIAGLVGTAVGAGLGTIVLPGVGTLCGALVGGPTGVYYGARLASRLTEEEQVKKVKACVNEYASKFQSSNYGM